MSLKEKLSEDMRSAMRTRDEVKLSTIRLVRSAIKNQEIDKGRELSDDEVVTVLMSEAKKRREAVEGAELASREDVAAKERAELDVVKQYLPEQIGESELEEIARGIITEVGATSMKDKGRVMPVLMQRVRGRADGRLASEVVDRLLHP
jgi:uncharacterized protein